MPGNLPAIGDPTNGRSEIGVHASASWLAGEVRTGDGISALVSGAIPLLNGEVLRLDGAMRMAPR
jgi:hypothetical protein